MRIGDRKVAQMRRELLPPPGTYSVPAPSSEGAIEFVYENA